MVRNISDQQKTNSTLSDEMKTDALEACVTAYDKFPNNNEHIARFLKVRMFLPFLLYVNCIYFRNYV